MYRLQADNTEKVEIIEENKQEFELFVQNVKAVDAKQDNNAVKEPRKVIREDTATIVKMATTQSKSLRWRVSRGMRGRDISAGRKGLKDDMGDGGDVVFLR